jgi:methyl-accepting chemotaxis protein
VIVRLERRQSIRFLTLCVTVMLAVAALACSASVYLGRRMQTASAQLAELRVLGNETTALYAQGLQMCQATRNILLDPANPKAYDNHRAAAADFQRLGGQIRKRMEKLYPHDPLLRDLESIMADHDRHMDVQHRVHSAAAAGQSADGIKILNREDTPLWRKYKDAILKLGKDLGQRAELATESINGEFRNSERLQWCAAFVLMGMAAVTFLGTQRVKDALVFASQQLHTLSREVLQTSGYLAQASCDLARQASEQATSVSETTAATEAIREVSRTNALNADSVTQLAEEAGSLMQSALRDVDAMNTQFEDLRATSQAMGSVIQTIDDIALQTNILALNASVEAARAGYAGEGFRIVAGQVRTMADRTAQAAKETAQLIRSSVSKVNAGSESLAAITQALQSNASILEKVEGLAKEVDSSAHSQAGQFDRVSGSLEILGRTSQQVAAASEETSSTATEMRAHVGGLNEALAELSRICHHTFETDGKAPAVSR